MRNRFDSLFWRISRRKTGLHFSWKSLKALAAILSVFQQRTLWRNPRRQVPLLPGTMPISMHG